MNEVEQIFNTIEILLREKEFIPEDSTGNHYPLNSQVESFFTSSDCNLDQLETICNETLDISLSELILLAAENTKPGATPNKEHPL